MRDYAKLPIQSTSNGTSYQNGADRISDASSSSDSDLSKLKRSSALSEADDARSIPLPRRTKHLHDGDHTSDGAPAAAQYLPGHSSTAESAGPLASADGVCSQMSRCLPVPQSLFLPCCSSTNVTLPPCSGLRTRLPPPTPPRPTPTPRTPQQESQRPSGPPTCSRRFTSPSHYPPGKPQQTRTCRSPPAPQSRRLRSWRRCSGRTRGAWAGRRGRLLFRRIGRRRKAGGGHCRQSKSRRGSSSSNSG